MLNLEEKKNCLIEILKRYNSLIIAFSGGVDSAFLLAMSHIVLKDKVVAVTASSSIHTEREKQNAIKFAEKIKVKHIIIQTKEVFKPDFIANEKDRCYVCKKYFFQEILKITENFNINNIAHGANLDDNNDFRPGFKAAKEMGVLAPLIEAKFLKNDIRLISKEMGLSTWDKPSMACLATRIPYGTKITQNILKMIEDAENIIFDLGFDICRVRFHDYIARIEIPNNEFNRMLSFKKEIIEKLKKIGFFYISIDLEGYVQGSMNINLEKKV